MGHKSCDLSARFAVYCGAGVYVRAVSLDRQTNLPVVETGALHGALPVSRRVAVGALHAARRAGLSAWLVQHPARAIGAAVACGVA